jgi:hypothetical protein
MRSINKKMFRRKLYSKKVFKGDQQIFNTRARHRECVLNSTCKYTHNSKAWEVLRHGVIKDWANVTCNLLKSCSSYMPSLIGGRRRTRTQTY